MEKLIKSTRTKLIEGLVDLLMWFAVFLLGYGCVYLVMLYCFGLPPVSDANFGGMFWKQLWVLEVSYAGVWLLLLTIVAWAAYGAGGDSTCWWRILCRWSFRGLCLLFFFVVAFAWAHYVYAGRFPSSDSALFYLRSPWHLMQQALHFSDLQKKRRH